MSNSLLFVGVTLGSDKGCACAAPFFWSGPDATPLNNKTEIEVTGLGVVKVMLEVTVGPNATQRPVLISPGKSYWYASVYVLPDESVG